MLRVVGLAGLAGCIAAAWTARHVERVVVSGTSMEPALLEGDRLLVVAGAPIRTGSVVAARDPRFPERILVKRVHGISSTAVEVRGDAADRSTDSRIFGPLPVALVRGRVVWRYAPAARAGPIRSVPPVPARIESWRQPAGADGTVGPQG